MASMVEKVEKVDIVWPKPETKYFEILKSIDTLSKNSTGGRVPLGEIYVVIKGARESLREILWLLKNKGLVETPMRGFYGLTDAGREVIVSHAEQG